MELRTTRLIRVYKTVLETVCSRVYLEVKKSTLSLCMKELKVAWKELKRHTIGGKITSLEAKASELIDLIGHILCKLYLKHTLYLVDRRITPHVYISCDNLLNLFLAVGGSSLRYSVSNIGVCIRHFVDDYLIVILRVPVSINLPWAVRVSTAISSSLRVFMWCFEAKFVLYRSITNYFKKIIEREEVITLN